MSEEPVYEWEPFTLTDQELEAYHEEQYRAHAAILGLTTGEWNSTDRGNGVYQHTFTPWNDSTMLPQEILVHVKEKQKRYALILEKLALQMVQEHVSWEITGKSIALQGRLNNRYLRWRAEERRRARWKKIRARQRRAAQRFRKKSQR